jgi:hypothetical protein
MILLPESTPIIELYHMLDLRDPFGHALSRQQAR